MRHPNLLDSKQALLLIVDIQESFRKVLPDLDELISGITTLAKAAKILQLPTVVTEQYPKGLGKTLEEITSCLGQSKSFAKTSFSCAGAHSHADELDLNSAQTFMDYLESTGRKQIIVCGMETHVCVSQTVHDLLQYGYQMHVVADAVSSRFFKNKEIGLQKMLAAGAIITSVETALFEMLGNSDVVSFKAIQQLVK